MMALTTKGVSALAAALSVLATIVPNETALAQTSGRTPAAPTKETCAELARRYDYSNRMIAEIDAEDLIDDSAPRSTVRQLKILSEKQDQLILLEFMRMRGCPAPSAIGGSIDYLANALACATAKLKGDYKSPECKMSDWQTPGEKPAAPAN